MRLIYSGLFDRYPGLKIVLGHMGGGIFYFTSATGLFRIDKFWDSCLYELLELGELPLSRVQGRCVPKELGCRILGPSCRSME